MQPIDVYLLYCAMKAHFGEGDYDFHRFGGKSKVSRDSFYKRNDRYFFARLGLKYKEYDQIRDYLVANFVRKSASSTAELPPPTTATCFSLKKKPSHVAQADTPKPL